MNNLNLFILEIKKEFPKFKIINKKDSLFIKIVGWFLYIITFGSQNSFMESYVTTINNNVYLPKSWNFLKEETKIMILKHERVHMRQAKRYGFVLFSFLYIFVFFPFVFAYYRTKFEKEAYEENIKFAFEKGGEELIRSDKYKEHILKYFLTGQYGWMCPFRSYISEWYDKIVEKIVNSSKIEI
jgi:hypothetical protein